MIGFFFLFPFIDTTIESHNPIMVDKYGKMNATIERMSTICCTMLVKFTIPAIVITSTFLTLVDYFIFNLGDDSYILGMPILCVFKQKKKQLNKCEMLRFQIKLVFVHLV